MPNLNGLIAPPAYKNPEVPYYAQADAPVIQSPTLVSNIALQSGDGTSTGYLTIGGAAAGGYQGAVSIQSGDNALAPGNQVCLTMRGAASGCIVEVGDNAQASNILYIAGASGVSQVNDPVYNPAVSLKALTLSATNPLCAPTPGNTGELFRCAQAGVAAAAVAAIGTNFQVPQSGWYSLQIEVQLENALAPAAPDINVPVTPVGTIDIGETLSFVIAQGVVVEPYGAHECVSSEFLASAITQQGGNVIRQYVSQHLLAAGTTYTFTLRSSSASWNIGSEGSIKAELIAMC